MTHMATKRIVTLTEAARIARRARWAGKRVVTTNGCFDILHVGHIHNLEAARALGDLLIVGVNSDASVSSFKGPGRPIVTARERAEVLAALRPVDYVLIFSEPTPNRWLAAVRPHVHVKGGDRPMSQIVERDVVRRAGGKIVLLKTIAGKSTTNIIGRIARTLRKRS